MKPQESRLTSRKFLVIIATVVCATWLAHNAILTADQWITTVKWALGIYVPSQAFLDWRSKAIEAVTEKPDGVQPG